MVRELKFKVGDKVWHESADYPEPVKAVIISAVPDIEIWSYSIRFLTGKSVNYTRVTRDDELILIETASCRDNLHQWLAKES